MCAAACRWSRLSRADPVDASLPGPQFHGPITALSLAGYGLAFAAVMFYNWSKLVAMKEAEAQKDSSGKEAKASLVAGAQEEEMKTIPLTMKPGGNDNNA